LNGQFFSKLEQISDSDKTVLSVGHNTFFTHDGDATLVRYVTDKGTAELALGTIEELCEGSSPFESTDDDWVDVYLPLLVAIESGISGAYEDDPDLKDKDLVTILERLIMKPDIQLNSPVAVAIQDHIKLTLVTNTYYKKEVIGALRKVLRSVRRHHAVDSPKGYLNFIKDKV
jgi:hypothetical protein